MVSNGGGREKECSSGSDSQSHNQEENASATERQRERDPPDPEGESSLSRGYRGRHTSTDPHGEETAGAPTRNDASPSAEKTSRRPEDRRSRARGSTLDAIRNLWQSDSQSGILGTDSEGPGLENTPEEEEKDSGLDATEDQTSIESTSTLRRAVSWRRHSSEHDEEPVAAPAPPSLRRVRVPTSVSNLVGTVSPGGASSVIDILGNKGTVTPRYTTSPKASKESSWSSRVYLCCKLFVVALLVGCSIFVFFRPLRRMASRGISRYPLESVPMPEDGVILPHQAQFAHAVNSKAKLNRVLKKVSEHSHTFGGINFLEGDVIRDKASWKSGSTNVRTITPMMGHDSGTDSDLSLDTFLRTIVEYLDEKNKLGEGEKEGEEKSAGGKTMPIRLGVKLDFKEMEVVRTSLQILSRWKSALSRSLLHIRIMPNSYHSSGKEEVQTRPGIILNADVFSAKPYSYVSSSGNEFKKTKELLRLFGSFCPRCIYSLGWRTAWEKGTYSKEDIDRMVNAVSEARRESNKLTDGDETEWVVSYAIRASWLSKSWNNVKRLLREHRYSSLALWCNHELESKELSFIQQYLLDPVSFSSRMTANAYLPVWLDIMETRILKE
eukprot:gb/GECG01007261.1/.p1 GENE.gb/GECG01007261.1/~~gb/GECG01007261.1/.p1  ORF type:complete len:609 (+),score=65.50 gb/GECG01007261.1/:1-1827(+)